MVWKRGKRTWKVNLKREDLQEEEKDAQILRIHYRPKRAYLSINLFVFRDELKFLAVCPSNNMKTDVFPEINIYSFYSSGRFKDTLYTCIDIRYEY